eukprot:6474949-Amphidinium_carterae.1
MFASLRRGTQPTVPELTWPVLSSCVLDGLPLMSMLRVPTGRATCRCEARVLHGGKDLRQVGTAGLSSDDSIIMT